MHRIDLSAGQVIASDTQGSVQAVDQAVIAIANMCASIVEVSNASSLPVSTAQGALANAGEGLSKLIASRADISGATRELTRIQRSSSLRETNLGCPPLKGELTAVDAAIVKQEA